MHDTIDGSEPIEQLVALGSGQSILVVDGEATRLSLLGNALSSQGYQLQLVTLAGQRIAQQRKAGGLTIDHQDRLAAAQRYQLLDRLAAIDGVVHREPQFEAGALP
ncbi:hypothetical protein, partial [Pseudomonas syringae group genomosp. 7]|uniref:hypothetical protein n=1 Tax=Pseudomonas syringae group genomosp. 7 TaxID=251699 RepID=UPI00376FF342